MSHKLPIKKKKSQLFGDVNKNTGMSHLIFCMKQKLAAVLRSAIRGEELSLQTAQYKTCLVNNFRKDALAEMLFTIQGILQRFTLVLL